MLGHTVQPVLTPQSCQPTLQRSTACCNPVRLRRLNGLNYRGNSALPEGVRELRGLGKVPK